MAKMFPERINEYASTSHEEVAFEKFKKLPKDYYVFHSFRIHRFTEENVFVRRECDFIIFHPQLGILCIECKSKKDIIKFKVYDKTLKKTAKLADHLIKIFSKQNIDGKGLNKYCKISYAVCILNRNESDFREEWKKSGKSPDEDTYRLIIFKDELEDVEKLEKKITSIMSMDQFSDETGKIIEVTPRPDLQTQIVNFLKWKFSLYSAINDECLNPEQLTVLDIMTYQPLMAVYGFAGTGKTVLALQKARMEAADNNVVLYLCSTPLMEGALREMVDNEDLWREIKNKIIFRTIDGLKEDWNLAENGWEKLIQEKLENLIEKDKEKDKDTSLTVIVDEGQDFGTPDRERLITGIFNFVAKGNTKPSDEALTLLQADRRGSFYIFYDQLQLFKGKKLPGIINLIDCRIPLIRNCRNTKHIAESAFSPIWGEPDKIMYGPRAEKGDPVECKYCKNDAEILSVLDNLLMTKDVDEMKTVILTAKEDFRESVLWAGRTEKQFVETGNIRNYKPDVNSETTYMFTTVSDYKGLECGQIILIDFVPNELIVEHSDAYKRLFYTAVSRATRRARILVKNSDPNKYTTENIRTSRLPKVFLEEIEKNKKGDYETPRKNFATVVKAEADYVGTV